MHLLQMKNEAVYLRSLLNFSILSRPRMEQVDWESRIVSSKESSKESDRTKIYDRVGL